MNIYSCVTWVKRGIAKSQPDRVKLDKEELRRVIEETKEQIAEEEILSDHDSWEDLDSEDDEEQKSSTKKHKLISGKDSSQKRKHDDDDDIVDKYGLDDYDDDNEGDKNVTDGIGKLLYYASNEEDPYITLQDDDSDEEDLEIKPTDNLVIAGKAEKDACILEIHVYNEELSNLFLHHDIILPSFPLAVEWIDFDPADGKQGNFIAVGSMEPAIDIWDLDVVDTLEPVAVLGSKKKKKKKKKTSGHTDAVLDLSWNHHVRTALASASADFTVALWDLTESTIVTSLQQHKEKVQCVKWHPFEAQSLLTGSFDKTVKVFDCRNPNDNHKSWNVDGEVERVTWDHFSPFHFFASTDSGMVYYHDVRQNKPVFTIKAHTSNVTGCCLSSQIPGLLTTSSADKTFKVWDIRDNKPSLILDRNLKMNELQCVSGCQESPFVFAIGGEKHLKIWDIRESAAVRKRFMDRMPKKLAAECEGDHSDLTEETEAMENLTIDNELEEELGDLIEPSNSSTSETKVKKKKKKKKKKSKD